MRNAAGVVAIAAAWLVVGHAALAQPSGEAEAQALALFKEAVAALDKEDYAAACPRFDAAMKLYPSPSTQLNIAKCLEHAGKIASAWAAYQRALVLNHATKDEARRAALDGLATRGSQRLEPMLPRLRILAPNAPPGLRVVEGTQELPTSFGIALPTDPGPHEFVASAPGYEDLHVAVTAETGKQADVTIALKPASAGTPGVVQPLPLPIATAAPPKAVPVTAPPARARIPAWAWTSGGLGLVALGVGAGFGIVALGKQSSLASACGSQFPQCPKDAQTMSKVNGFEDARDVDRAAFIGLAAAGVVGLGAAVIGIALARTPKKDDAPRQVGFVVAPFGSPLGGGVMVERGF